MDTTVSITPTTVPAVIKTALPIFSAFIIGPVTCKFVGNAPIIANAKNDERILSAEETIMLLENTAAHMSFPAANNPAVKTSEACPVAPPKTNITIGAAISDTKTAEATDRQTKES